MTGLGAMMVIAVQALQIAQPAPPDADLSAAATVVVSGKVLARGGSEALAGASITVDGAAAGEADEAGRFALVMSPGRHVVQFQHPGHDPLTTVVDARADTPPMRVRLEPAAGAFTYETVVRATPTHAPVALRKEEITKTAGSLGDPFRVVESLPGVSPIVWPLAIYSVRGANPGNTGFLVDGLRVPALFHFALGPAVIHPYFLEGLDFYAGAYPARYGRSVAGLVAASTAVVPSDRPHGSVDVRLYDAGAILTTPIDRGRGGVAVAGRYGYPGALLNLLQEEVRVQYWDYQARVDHLLGSGRATLLAFGAYDSVLTYVEEQPGGPATPRDQLTLTFHRADLRWRGGAGRGQVTARLGAGFDLTEVPLDDEGEVASETRRLMPRLSYSRPLGRAVDLELGADGEWASYRPRIGIETGGAALAPFALPRTVFLGGAWTELTLRLGDRVVVTPGARVDLYAEGHARAVDPGPRLEVRVRASDAVWLKASGGRFSQMATFPLEVPGIEGFGLGTLGLQTAWQGAVGVEAQLPGAAALSLDTSSFVHRYVLTDIRDPVLSNPFLDDFLTRRDALSYGLEVMLRRPPRARTYGWISYTLSRALRAFDGGVVTDADWDQRHVLNLVGGHRWRRWNFGGRFHLHSGRPVTVEASRPVEFARLPPFFQIDVRIERRFLFDAFALDVYLEAVNATANYQTLTLRRTNAGTVEGEGFRIVLPSLGVRGEF